MTLHEAHGAIMIQYMECHLPLQYARWAPNSPAWHYARERELAKAIHAINYHSHRRPA